MVRDTVALPASAEGRRVFLDCEHFFDGYTLDRDYGVRVLEAAVARRRRRRRPVRHQRRHAADGRARRSSPTCAAAPASGSASTARTTPAARWPTPWPPSRPAPPTSRAPRTATASGPATPTSSRVIGNLVTKMGLPTCCRTGAWPRCSGSRTRSPSSPTSPPTPTSPTSAPSAFAHKAGLHASARSRSSPELYNHLDPARGRQRHAHPGHRDGRPGVGRAEGARARASTWPARPDVVGRVVDRVKELRGRRLVVRGRRRLLRAAAARRAARRARAAVRAGVLPGDRRALRGTALVVSEATVKVHVGGERVIATAEGNGPVNALDRALRQALVAGVPAARRASSWPTTRCASWLAGTAPSADHPGADRDHRRRAGVDHRRRARQRRRGVLAGPGRRAHLRRPPAPGRD